MLDALSPLIGAELESGKAVKAGWAKDVKEDKISEWTQKGTDSVKDELVDEAMRVMQVEYWGQLRKVRIACMHGLNQLLNTHYGVCIASWIEIR